MGNPNSEVVVGGIVGIGRRGRRDLGELEGLQWRKMGQRWKLLCFGEGRDGLELNLGEEEEDGGERES